MKKSIRSEKEKIRKSLKYSILDGAFYSAMVGFGESFFSAFAVFLKATNIQLGLLGSLPLTIGSILQIYSNKLLKLFKSRKSLIFTGVLFQAIMYIPVTLVFFFGKFKVSYLILFACLYWLFGMIINPAWSSWMGDLTNEQQRGNYFGRRNKISSLVAFIAFMLGGYTLQRFSGGTEIQYVGFIVIFAIAMTSRMISLFYIAKKYEPTFVLGRESEFTFTDFLKQARSRNYGLFVIYLCFMNFAVYLAGPFFTAYMLYDLHLSYHSYALVIGSAIVAKFLTMPVWGKLSDKYGTKKVLTTAGYLMPIVPLLWLFSKDIRYLVLIQVYSGFVWAAFDIASFNFIFDTTTSEKRTTCVAYYNILNGVSILLGAVLGSLIVKYNSVFWSKYLLVFIVSFAVRYMASIIFIPKLREVRTVKTIPYSRLLIKVFTGIPPQGMSHHFLPFGKKNSKK